MTMGGHPSTVTTRSIDDEAIPGGKRRRAIFFIFVDSEDGILTFASLLASARDDIQNAHLFVLFCIISIADSLSRYYAIPTDIICDIILAFS